MQWATRHPFAPQIASLGLGEIPTQSATPGIDAAMLLAQQKRRDTGRPHYVITQADAVMFSRPSYYTLDARYFPGFAVINDVGESKLPANVTTWWWPAGASYSDVRDPSPPTSRPGGGGPAPSSELPLVAEGGGLSDTTVKVLAFGGGFAAAAAAIWFLTR